jgi:hypothetical protein
MKTDVFRPSLGSLNPTPAKALKQYKFYSQGTKLDKNGNIALTEAPKNPWGGPSLDKGFVPTATGKLENAINIPDGWDLWNGDSNINEYDVDPETGYMQGQPDRVTMYRDYDKNYRQYQVMDKTGKLVTGPTLSRKGGSLGPLGKIFKVAAPIAMGALAPGIGSALGGGLLGSVGGGAIAGATAGGLSGGGGKGILKGALMGGVGGGLNSAVGGITKSAGLTGIPAKVASGAIKGGVGSLLNGGNVGKGILSGAVGSGLNSAGNSALSAIGEKTGMSSWLDSIGNFFGGSGTSNSAPGNYSAANDFGSGVSPGENSWMTTGNLNKIGGLVTTGAGLINTLKGSRSAPKAPNFQQLASQDTAVNRPNQNTPFGSTQWVQGPNGQWTQNVSLNPQDQARLDATRGQAAGLLGQAGGTLSKPLDMASLPQSRNVMDAVGNDQAIQDATYKLMQPQRQLARNDEINRLKAQGLPEDSEAFQRAMTRLDQGDTEAQIKALLAGKQEYGNAFNRSNTAANTVQALRNQGINEQQAVAMDPIQRLTALLGSGPQNPIFNNFATGGSQSNAGMNSYQAAMDKFNASVANKSNQTQGLFELAKLFQG